MATNQTGIIMNSLCSSAFIILTALSSVAAYAQTTPDIATGESPYAVYKGGDIDNVNPVNGNVFLKIPLLSYPQRGKDLRLDFYIYYNDKQWHIANLADDSTGHYTGNWSGGETGQNATVLPNVGVYVARDQAMATGFDDNQSVNVGNGGQYNQFIVTTDLWGFYAATPDGSKHYVGDVQFQSCSSGTGTCPQVYSGYSNAYPSTDGTGIRSTSSLFTTPFSVQDAQGIKYAATTTSNSVTDLNGNSINSSASGWTDSTGRTIPGSYSPPGSTTTVSNGSEPFPGINLPAGQIGNCPSGTTAARQWIVPAFGTTATYYLCYTSHTYLTAFNMTALRPDYTITEASSSGPGLKPTLVLSAIVLPTGRSYTFSYDQYLSLQQITLPTGGTIAYTWQNIPFEQSQTAPISRAVHTRTVTPGSGQPAETWTYNYSYTVSNGTISNPIWSVITDPQGNDEERQIGLPNGFTGYATSTANYSGCSPHDTFRSCSTGTLIKTESYAYSPAGSGGADQNTPSVSTLLKPTTTTTTWTGGPVTQTVLTPSPAYGTCNVYYNFGGSLTPQQPQTTTISNCFSTGQMASTAEYDYGATAPGALLRTTTTTFKWQTAPAYLTANVLNIPSSTVISNSSGTRVAETDYNYDETGSPQGTIGNLTSTSKWNNNGANVTSSIQYNSQGVPISSKDGNGNPTSFGTLQCSGAYPGQIINALGQITTLAYDCNTGLVSSTTDPNSKTTSYQFDNLGRKTKTIFPDTGSTTVSFNGDPVPPKVTVTTATTPSPGPIVHTTLYDGVGRPIQTQLTSDTSGVDYTDTSYDNMGRLHSVSNPYQSSANPTDGTTVYNYDPLGRVVTQVQPDGASLQWCYEGIATNGQTNCSARAGSQTNRSWIDATDEAGRHWQRDFDALGRLTQVMEPDPASGSLAIETDYQYDSLGNLLKVDQWGGASGSAGDRQRTFTYDSLSRLLTATNPEIGLTGTPMPITYGYDANGNATSKTDPRGTVSMTYDALNRLTTKKGTGISYVYLYDTGTGTNLVGRLFKSSNTVNAGTAYSYDSLGRVISAGYYRPSSPNYTTLTTSATYDLAGNLISLTYPDGRKINYAYSAAGRLANVTQPSVPTPYVNVTSTWPTGAWKSATFGNGTQQSDTYNNRLQPSELVLLAPDGTTKLADKQYSYVGPTVLQPSRNSFVAVPCNSTTAFGQGNGNEANNGNVCGINDALNASHGQAYHYDLLNRLIFAEQTDSGFNQTFSLDAWGNLTQSGTSSFLPTSYSTQNRINGFGITYDAAGNITKDQFPNTYTYDALNQVTSNSAGGVFTYDSDGERIRKAVGSTTWTEYISFGGNTIAEKNSDGTWSDYIFAGGKRIVQFASGATTPTYYWTDHLGTSRIMTNSAGASLGEDIYAPYGQPVISTLPTHYKFTGKERDTESGLDYFGARFYGSTMGRFLSPDPSALYFANPANPQSLNLYTYVLNNPMINTDPDGRECVWDNGSYDSADDPDTGKQKQCEGQGGHYVDPTAFATLGLPDWSEAPNKKLVGMINQLNGTSDTVTVSATDAGIDLLSSSLPGALVDYAGGPVYMALGNPYRLFSTKFCGPGGGGTPNSFLDAACKAHDDCYKAAGISAANNGPNGTMTPAQASAASACNQALYNAARIDPKAPGATAVRYWLTQGANVPFAGTILRPGTEAKPW